MTSWRPATREEVERILADEMKSLSVAERARFEPLRVTPRPVPVESSPNEFVYVVAEYQGKVLYWSDIEGGWELEPLDPSGAITERGSNQFELKHIIFQLFGELDALPKSVQSNFSSSRREEA